MGTKRREQILRTAAELFASRGFHGVSVHDVGAACGISGPALYRHFASKDAMLTEMLVTTSANLLAEGRARAERAPSPEAALHDLIAWHVEFALGNRALIVVQDRDWASLGERARAEVRSLQTAYVGLWTCQLRRLRPELPDRTADACVRATFGLLNSTPHSARLSRTRMRNLLQGMAWAALTGPTAPAQ